MEKVISEGERQGLLKVSENRVEYTLAKRKSYKLTDPEERVRTSFCVELVRKYQYPKERIDLEVEVPRREPKDKADIVVYEDDELKMPYIVVECKPDGISPPEIKQAIEQAFGNAHSLGAKYTIVVAGSVRVAFDMAGFPPMERERNIIADIPIRYGKLIKFKYKKGEPEWDIREVDKNEILAKFQQCHDTLWEAGKRNPAEAFDEMSKLMFCKIHDERFLTKKDQYYRFQIGTHEEIREVAERVKNIYQDARRIDPDVFVDPIKAEDPIIYGVVEILQGISLSQTDLDAKGVAFEHFLGAVFRGEMGQYFTPRPIVEFMVEMLSPDENDFVIDPACGSGGFLLYALDKVKKELEESLSPRDADYRWRNFGLKQLFGIEINSQLARVAMINMIIHEDGHSNIENNDSLDSPEKFNPRRDIKLGKYTCLLTNPPFGAVTKEREKPYLSEYELGSKIKKRNRQNTEILFIERCLAFLAFGGRMGIVLPDGVLTNSSLQYVRDFITEKAQILAVVSLPQTSFVHYGSGVKASLLFLRKKQEGEKLTDDYPIFMAIAEHIGYDATGRPDKNELPEILKAYRGFIAGESQNFPNAPLCFSIERGEIDDAFNPLRFKLRLPKKEKWLKIKDIGAIIFETYNPRKNAPEEEFDWIRIDDLKNDPIEVTSVRHVKGKEIKGLVQMLQEEDVLIARLGPCISNKKFVIVPHTTKQPIGSTEFIVLRPDENFDRYFILSVFKTDFYTNLMFSKGRGGIPSRYRLNRTDFSLLPFPNVNIRTQQEIGMQVNQAFKIKKEKETEAEELLNSIEDYVLGELGIKVPDLKEQKYFTIPANGIKGKRLDPYYFQPKFKILEKALNSGQHPLEPLGKFITEIRYGVSTKNIYADDGIPLLRIHNLKPNTIDLAEVVKLPFDKKKQIGRCHVYKGDFLISRSGTIGVVARVPKEADGFAFGSFMIKFKIKEQDMNPLYLSFVMNLDIVQKQMQRDRIGAVQGNITIPVIKSILIPLPPLAIQETIAKEVQARRDRARTLKGEAQQILERAKDKVERMILE